MKALLRPNVQHIMGCLDVVTTATAKTPELLQALTALYGCFQSQSLRLAIEGFDQHTVDTIIDVTLGVVIHSTL